MNAEPTGWRGYNAFRVYTDGSYSSQRRLGSIVCLILRYGKVWAKAKSQGDFTNANGAELSAALLALSMIPAGAQVNLNSDSRFVQYAAEISASPASINRWIARSPAERGPFLPMLQTFRRALDLRNITVSWVRGDGSNIYNLWCDRTCNEAMHDQFPNWWLALELGDSEYNIFDSSEYKGYRDVKMRELAWIHNFKEKRLRSEVPKFQLAPPNQSRQLHRPST